MKKKDNQPKNIYDNVGYISWLSAANRNTISRTSMAPKSVTML